jgi:hypothetical protein
VTPDFLAKFILPAAASLLPSTHDSLAARRILIAIALQESGCRARRQYGDGPAKSFWQFEPVGVNGVLAHKKAGQWLKEAAAFCDVVASVEALHGAIEHNDILAAALARLALWVHPDAIPETELEAWQFYLSTWRPGKPKAHTWAGHWAKACSLIPTNQVVN